jgi:hypothetical protein
LKPEGEIGNNLASFIIKINCMRKFYCTLTIACSFIQLHAQDVTVKQMQDAGTKAVKGIDSNGWKKSGTLILNLNQGALSNWVAGGEQNVFGINGIFNYAFNYKMGKNIWDNYFDVALGFQNATSFKKFRKIDDRVDITSKYGRQLSKNWYYGILFNSNSQVLPGYDYSTDPPTKISSFLTPGKIILSPGFDFKPNDKFSLFMSPATVRWVLKRDEDFYSLAKFGVDPGKKVNTEIGAFVTAKYKEAITKWATYTGRLDLFSNYRRKPGNVDVLMNNLLTMSFTKNFATNLSVDLLYDDDVLKKLQLKEILGIGLTMKLQ